jgi:peptide/nickel transport system ATP-binding protein
MIAMALATSPDLLIADEPTTALDVTVQKSILELLLELRDKYELSILFITHDLHVLNQIADEIAVIYNGEIVESGSKNDIFNSPKTPYAKGLLACKPRLDQGNGPLKTIADFLNPSKDNEKHFISSKNSLKNEVLLSVNNLSISYKKWKVQNKAVNAVSFEVYKGETLGLVGESGCGKTSIGRSILQLIDFYSGSIQYRGQPLNELSTSALRSFRRKIQIVFQDPYSSLNPAKTVGSILAEPLRVHKLVDGRAEEEHRVMSLLNQVGLEKSAVNLYPHQFSGGQRQRIGIARALACEPEFIVLDESVSALDVSVQAQILNLLNSLKREHDLTYIFISHDLTVVKYMSDRVLVMSEGSIVESGFSEKIFSEPKHDYTKTLISSIPV